jgi:hypothetical protein
MTVTHSPILAFCPKKRCLLEGYRVLSACPSDKAYCFVEIKLWVLQGVNTLVAQMYNKYLQLLYTKDIHAKHI